MGAKEGNQNARKKGHTRVPVALSIGEKRLSWAIERLRQGGVAAPTQAQIIRFVKDFCYEKIDNEFSQLSQNPSNLSPKPLTN